MGRGNVPDAWDDDWIEKADVGTGPSTGVIDTHPHSLLHRSLSQLLSLPNSPRLSAVLSKQNLTGSYGKMRKDEGPISAANAKNVLQRSSQG